MGNGIYFKIVGWVDLDMPHVKLQVLGNNSKTVNNIKNLTWSKTDQHIKIYLPCNFEVNPITHFGVISLFSSNCQNFNTFRPLFQKL
jgi:hypothetical protein